MERFALAILAAVIVTTGPITATGQETTGTCQPTKVKFHHSTIVQFAP